MGPSSMYRDSQQSFAQTIERLERELAELQAVHRPPRPSERALWALTALSVVAAILAGVACASAHSRAEMLQRRFDAAASRLGTKTQDLNECMWLAGDRKNALQQCRIDAWQAQLMPAEGMGQASKPAATRD
jgi:hypothetical protein